jgi:hypothetical protein
MERSSIAIAPKSFTHLLRCLRRGVKGRYQVTTFLMI